MFSFLKKKKKFNPFPGDQELNLFSQRFIYEKFYGFSKDPFDSQPDPRLLFLTENVREVWNSLLSGIVQRKRFLLLTGERGIGKTSLGSLIYLFLATNGRRVNVIPLFDSHHQIEEILQTFLRNLGFSPDGENKGSMLYRLDVELAQRSARGENVTLIIDEAQNLGKETLEEIRLLANPNPKNPGLLQEIFVGEPQFEKNLRSRDLSLLNQRIEVRCRLRPFTSTESLGYIKHRLDKAGGTISRVFTPRAVSLIIQASGGNPGILNRVCQEVLSAGYSQLKTRIDSANVRDVLTNLGMGQERGWLFSPKNLPWIKKRLEKS